MNLAEMTWVDAEQALAKATIALVPVGAVEVYGPHLPQGSDGFAAQAFAARLAERVDAVVTPLVPVGCSQVLMSFPGTLSVSPEALKAYLSDLCDSLVHWGIRRILFVNGHAGNVPHIADICRELMDQGVKCAQIDWWRAVYRAGEDLTESGELANGHAAEVGTSVLKAIRPDLVVEERIKAELPKRGLAGAYPEVLQYDIPYRAMTASGVVGDPTSGNAAKGEAMIERLLDRVEAYLKEWQ
ncbi:MAG: creatininase family protein [Caldilineaceae bacterium]|nr:creatininase family protein [Caldilineaceae bacterium]